MDNQEEMRQQAGGVDVDNTPGGFTENTPVVSSKYPGRLRFDNTPGRLSGHLNVRLSAATRKANRMLASSFYCRVTLQRRIGNSWSAYWHLATDGFSAKP
jgi:hypothetical protein